MSEQIGTPTLSTAESLSSSPYRGLVPYLEKDAEFFFGRDRECEIILSSLSAHRLTLLYGESGVGKSSVLGAGVVYELRQRIKQNLKEWESPGLAVVYFNTWRDNPLIALMNAVEKTVREAWRERKFSQLPDSYDLPRFLKAWVERLQGEGELFIIPDQFEEYFLYHSETDNSEDKQSFAYQLASAINSSSLSVNFLISIREDALARLDRFKASIPGLFDHYLRIHSLDKQAARAAILGPLEVYNSRLPAENTPARIELELVDQILEQVETGQVTLSDIGKATKSGPNETPAELVVATDKGIETPYLQLVLTRLWDEERLNNSSTLKIATLQRLGGAQQIVRTHLDKVMGELTEEEQNIAARMYRHLVTTTGNKFAQSLGDLSELTDLPAEKLSPVLNKLTAPNLRVLRPVSPPPGFIGGPRYEIFHDVLAAAILDWRRRYTQQQRLFEEARELRERELQIQEKLRKRTRQLVLLVIGLLLTLLAGGIALFEWQQTEKQTRLNQRLRIAATASYLQDKKIDLALLLAVEATKRGDEVQSRITLANNLDSHSGIISFLYGHNESVESVTFSPDGKLIASASLDNSVMLWNVASHQPIAKLQGHLDGVLSVAFSPDGKILASSSRDNNIILWDVATHRPIGQPLKAHSDWVWNIAFSPDGKLLASASQDKTVILWDIESQQPIRRLSNSDSKGVWSVCFSPDGKLLASAGADNKITLWDIKNDYQKLTDLQGHTSLIWSLAFSSDSKLLASASDDKTIILWDVANKQKLGQSLQGHTAGVLSVKFSPDNKTLASAGGDNTIRLWDVAKLEQLTPPFQGHTSTVWSVAFSPDGTTLVSGSFDQKIILWSLASPDQTPPVHSEDVKSVAFSSNGKILASASNDKSVILWDVKSHKPLGLPLKGHSDQVYSVAFSSDGKFLASGSLDRTAILWDLSSSAPVSKTLTGHSGQVYSVAFSPNGKILASAGCGEWDNNKNECILGQIIFWDVATGTQVGQPIIAHKSGIRSIAFSPKDDVLAAGSGDNTISLWNTLTHTQIGQLLIGHHDGVWAVSFSRDGKLLASGSYDKTILLWNVASLQKQGQPLIGHTEAVESLAFSSDNKILASASDDKTIILWDVASQQQIGYPLKGHSSGVFSVAFDPGSSNDLRLASGGGDKKVLFWEISNLDNQQKRACSIANRNLTKEEWTTYIGEEPYQATCTEIATNG